MSYEYVVVPAPKKAPKVKGAKTGEARFAHALTEVMNSYAAEGWEYQRTDTLPCEERSGLTGTKTTFQNLLVFRRELEAPAYEMPEADQVQTPEELAAELAHSTPRIAPPAAAGGHAAAPRLSAAREDAPGASPRLGPAEDGEERRVHLFPRSGSDAQKD